MAETEFLAAIADYLKNRAGLAPAPQTIGVAEPVQGTDLPAVVLSLDSVQRLGSGLGERSALVTDGALPWTVTIDLANPVLPEEPTFRLLSDDKTQLILPHGGLRQLEGAEGPLGPSDLQVTVAGAPIAVVNASPGAGEVRADPAIGLLTFGSALPATGDVVVSYVLGQWERRVTQIAGVMRVDVRAASVTAAAELSAAVVSALSQATHATIKGLRKISVTSLSSVGLPDAQRADSRGRVALFSFDYEHEVNRPESSGGVIQRIPITSLIAGS